MNLVSATLVVLVGVIALLGFSLAHYSERSRRHVRILLAMLLVFIRSLVGQLLPAGVEGGTLTKLVLLAGATFFLGTVALDMWRNRKALTPHMGRA
jgi:lipopolysaccharide export LptBFGC system permease protein LptF